MKQKAHQDILDLGNQCHIGNLHEGKSLNLPVKQEHIKICSRKRQQDARITYPNPIALVSGKDTPIRPSGGIFVDGRINLLRRTLNKKKIQMPDKKTHNMRGALLLGGGSLLRDPKKFLNAHERDERIFGNTQSSVRQKHVSLVLQ